MNIIPFKPAEKLEPHATGEAICIGCRHKWIAVAPAGTTQLECPSCGTMKGVWMFPFNVSDGEFIRECVCGNDLFRLTPDGHLCANCGIYQRYD